MEEWSKLSQMPLWILLFTQLHPTGGRWQRTIDHHQTERGDWTVPELVTTWASTVEDSQPRPRALVYTCRYLGVPRVHLGEKRQSQFAWSRVGFFFKCVFFNFYCEPMLSPRVFPVRDDLTVNRTNAIISFTRLSCSRDYLTRSVFGGVQSSLVYSGVEREEWARHTLNPSDCRLITIQTKSKEPFQKGEFDVFPRTHFTWGNVIDKERLKMRL